MQISLKHNKIIQAILWDFLSVFSQIATKFAYFLKENDFFFGQVIWIDLHFLGKMLWPGIQQMEGRNEEVGGNEEMKKKKGST